MRQPNFERMVVVRKLNEASEEIRKELSHCREDRDYFPVNSSERISLDGKIDGLLESLKIIEKIGTEQVEEAYKDMVIKYEDT